MKLYHCTDSKNIPSIKEIGLHPNKSQSSLEAVFLAGSINTAKNYSLMRPEIEQYVIFEVDSETLDPTKCFADNYELPEIMEDMPSRDLKKFGVYRDQDFRTIPWEISLKICDQMAYFGVIPFKNLTVV